MEAIMAEPPYIGEEMDLEEEVPISTVAQAAQLEPQDGVSDTSKAADREGEAWRVCVREAAAAAKMEGTVTQAAQLEAQDGVSDTRQLIGMEAIMAGMGVFHCEEPEDSQRVSQLGH